jgi:hypothetical protein
MKTEGGGNPALLLIVVVLVLVLEKSTRAPSPFHRRGAEGSRVYIKHSHDSVDL